MQFALRFLYLKMPGSNQIFFNMYIFLKNEAQARYFSEVFQTAFLFVRLRANSKINTKIVLQFMRL